MINFIKNEFLKTLKYIKENLLKLSYITGIVFLAIAVVSFFLIKLVPENDIIQIYNMIYEMFDTKDIVDSAGNISALGLFKNNSQAMLITAVSGIIPFVFYPAFPLFINSLLVGVVLGIIDVITDFNIFYLILTKLLPHGIFELPALFVATSIGLKLCIVTTKKITGNKEVSFKYHLVNSLRVILFVIIPFLILAAIIEASL